MSTIEGWIENHKGNMVWSPYGDALATVYRTDDGMWGGVWNRAPDGKPRRLKARYDRSAEAQEAIEIADREGAGSARWWPPDDKWMQTKNGGYYRRVNGKIVSVKQAKSKSWYAIHMEGSLLGQHGRPLWFSTADEARKAVDASAVGSNGLVWITRQ